MMLKTITLLSVLAFFASCGQREQNEMSVSKATAEPHAVTPAIEPENSSIINEGVVIFGTDTFNIFSEYTNDVAYIQSTVDIDGNSTSLKYRDMVVHLVDKTNDTVTFRKEMFRNYMDTEDYDIMIMQSVVLNIISKKGRIPLMISLCQPDSDHCYNFDVRPDDKGKFVITGMSEEDFETP